MDTCIVETGLLKKKACGRPAVTHCLNCEGALCAEHAIAEVSDAGKRTGKFLCQECKAALKDLEKRLARVGPKPAATPPAAAARKPEAPAPAPQDKGAAGGLEFTPSDKNKPDQGQKS
jgi:hypothetical protein